MPEPIGQYRKPWAFSADVAGAATVGLKSARNATDATIFVTKITLSIITHAGAAVTFRDTTPRSIAVHNDLAAGAGIPSVVYWEFGKEGVELTLGKNFEVVNGGAGTYTVYAEGYEVANS